MLKLNKEKKKVHYVKANQQDLAVFNNKQVLPAGYGHHFWKSEPNTNTHKLFLQTFFFSKVLLW